MMSSEAGKRTSAIGAGRRRGIAPALWFACLALSQNALADHEFDAEHGHFHDDLSAADLSAHPRLGESLETQRIRELEAWLEVDPGSAAAAAAVARRYLEVFRYEGDPGLIVRAGAALAPWQDEVNPPAEVALERAVLWQTEHRFAAAFKELERLVDREPRNARAWLTLATVAKEIGRYAAARGACAQLLWLSDPAMGGACLASIWTDTGRAHRAYSILDGILREQHEELGVDVAIWLSSLAAEAAVAINRPDFAEAHFVAALEAAAHAGRSPEIYLLVEFADFLVEEDRPEEVVDLLRRAPRVPSITLREADVRRIAAF